MSREIFKSFGHVSLCLTVEQIDGQDGDTKVEIVAEGERHLLCWVSGEEYGDFAKELVSVVDKYRI